MQMPTLQFSESTHHHDAPQRLADTVFVLYVY